MEKYENRLRSIIIYALDRISISEEKKKEIIRKVIESIRGNANGK